MKPRFILFAFLIVPAWGTAEGLDEPQTSRPGEVVRVGDDVEDVFRILGEPNSRMETGKSAWFTYDRGEVRLKNDRVVFVSLVSEDVAEARKRAEAEARAERIREGEALRKAMREDPGTALRSPHERLALWTWFQERYPEVDVRTELHLARLEVAREEERVAERRRLAELERRVQIAEARARQAEFEAQFQGPLSPAPIEYRTRRHTSRRSGYSGPVITFRPFPVSGSRGDRVQGHIRVPSHTSTEIEEHRGGTGYVHGRSHGLRHERSDFTW